MCAVSDVCTQSSLFVANSQKWEEEGWGDILQGKRNIRKVRSR